MTVVLLSLGSVGAVALTMWAISADNKERANSTTEITTLRHNDQITLEIDESPLEVAS